MVNERIFYYTENFRESKSTFQLKYRLFSQSFEGAKSSASILSLLETAKRNGLDSEKYLTYLLEKLPNEESFAKKAVLEAYLPWSEIVQANCK